MVFGRLNEILLSRHRERKNIEHWIKKKNDDVYNEKTTSGKNLNMSRFWKT